MWMTDAKNSISESTITGCSHNANYISRVSANDESGEFLWLLIIVLECLYMLRKLTAITCVYGRMLYLFYSLVLLHVNCDLFSLCLCGLFMLLCRPSLDKLRLREYNSRPSQLGDSELLTQFIDIGNGRTGNCDSNGWNKCQMSSTTLSLMLMVFFIVLQCVFHNFYMINDSSYITDLLALTALCEAGMLSNTHQNLCII